MNSIIKYNKGYNIENLLRRIYIKYVYSGNNETNEIEILFSNILDLIRNAKNESELEEVESTIMSLLSKNNITQNEYNYFINLIEDRRKEI